MSVFGVARDLSMLNLGVIFIPIIILFGDYLKLFHNVNFLFISINKQLREN